MDSFLVDSMMPSARSRSVDGRQPNFGEKSPECRIPVKADEALVITKVQHELVMRLDADGQIPDGFAPVAEPGCGLCHKIWRQLSLFVQLPLCQKLRFEQAVFAAVR